MPTDPSESPDRSRCTRRALLTAAGTAGVGSIAGCTSLTSPSQLRCTYDVEFMPLGSPVLTAESGFVTTRSAERQSSRVHAVDITSGERRWRTSVPRALTAPQVRDDLVLIGTEAGLITLDRTSGDERWRVVTDGPATAVVPSPDGVYVAADGLLAVDGSGERRWNANREVVGPIAANAVTVAATTKSDDQERAVTGYAPADGTLQWRDVVPSGRFSVPRTLVDGNRVYTAGKRFTARDATTGERRWGFDPGDRESLSTPPIEATGLHVGTGVRFNDRDYGTVFSLSDGDLEYEYRAEATVAALRGDATALFATVGETVHEIDPELMTDRWSVNLSQVGAESGAGATLAARDGTCLVALEQRPRVVALSDG